MEKKDMTAIISRCLQQDSNAQESLVLAVQDRVYYHCRKMLKNEDLALDMTQEVLITMLTKLHTLQNTESFWSWLGGITANLCRNAINRGPREVQIPEDEEGNSLLDTYETLDEQTVPEKALDNDETRRMIAELVDDLPDAQRECVLLYYYDEMSVKDIAASLEVSENTIKSRLNYARKSIKEGVERYEKQGIKLYSLSVLPFLLFFLRKDASASSLTTEQVAQLTHRVVQGASAVATGTAVSAGTAAVGGTAGTAGGTAASASSTVASTAGATAKTAAAVVGKGLLGGLSTKVIAGVVAGLVLIGGIVGGVLLSDTKPSDSSYGIPMDYLEAPAWVDEPFDCVNEFIYEDSSIQVSEQHQSAQSFMSAYYSLPSQKTYFQANALLNSKQITAAFINNRWNEDAATNIHWQDISLGDSFETVLDKLGVEKLASEDRDGIAVFCQNYTDAPNESEYTIGYVISDTDFDQVIFVFHHEKNSPEDSGSSITLYFKQEKLFSFDYIYNPAYQVDSDPSAESEEDPAPTTNPAVPETGGPVDSTSANENDFVIEDGVLIEYIGQGSDVVIPDSVTSIGYKAFKECTSLTSVTISDSVTQIGFGAFDSCSNLTSVTIPDSVISIESYAFRGCFRLESVVIPNSVTKIADWTFHGCRFLTSVTIPDSVTEIGNYAFSSCMDLTTINIPDSVTSIGEYAFENCFALMSIVIPDSVTNINEGAFCNCSSLDSITIPNSVTRIRNSTFSNCFKLVSIVIPNSVTRIGYDVFAGCLDLTDIFYGGTEEEWAKIGSNNNKSDLANVTIHYNFVPAE